MDITKKAKEELENRVQKIENFIAHKGVGSAYLERARRVQRNVNLAIFVGATITLAGITYLILNSSDD